MDCRIFADGILDCRIFAEILQNFCRNFADFLQIAETHSVLQFLHNFNNFNRKIYNI